MARRPSVINAPVVVTRQHRNLEGLIQRVHGKAGTAAYNFARNGVVQVRSRAPVDTGYMASKVKWKRNGPFDFEVYVDGNTQTETGAYYAPYVEYGHVVRNQYGTHGYEPAQPFFRPGIRAAQEMFKREMKAVFR